MADHNNAQILAYPKSPLVGPIATGIVIGLAFKQPWPMRFAVAVSVPRAHLCLPRRRREPRTNVKRWQPTVAKRLLLTCDYTGTDRWLGLVWGFSLVKPITS